MLCWDRNQIYEIFNLLEPCSGTLPINHSEFRFLHFLVYINHDPNTKLITIYKYKCVPDYTGRFGDVYLNYSHVLIKLNAYIKGNHGTQLVIIPSHCYCFLHLRGLFFCSPNSNRLSASLAMLATVKDLHMQKHWEESPSKHSSPLPC